MQKTLLLGIGAQRAGTTWLFDYLAQHPQVFGGETKEFHFWDEYFRDGGERWTRKLSAAYDSAGSKRKSELSERLTIKDPMSYFAYFDRMNKEERPYVLDITPSYALMTRENFQRISEQAQRAGYAVNAIYILRDPVNRYYSHLNYRAGKRGRLMKFEHGLQGKPGQRSRYDVTLEAVKGVFPLTVDFFETMTVPKDTSRLMTSLGLPHITPVDEQRINSSVKGDPISDDKVATALSAFKPTYDYVNAHFGDQKPASWRA